MGVAWICNCAEAAYPFGLSLSKPLMRRLPNLDKLEWSGPFDKPVLSLSKDPCRRNSLKLGLSAEGGFDRLSPNGKESHAPPSVRPEPVEGLRVNGETNDTRGYASARCAPTTPVKSHTPLQATAADAAASQASITFGSLTVRTSS